MCLLTQNRRTCPLNVCALSEFLLLPGFIAALNSSTWSPSHWSSISSVRRVTLWMLQRLKSYFPSVFWNTLEYYKNYNNYNILCQVIPQDLIITSRKWKNDNILWIFSADHHCESLWKCPNLYVDIYVYVYVYIQVSTTFSTPPSLYHCVFEQNT